MSDAELNEQYVVPPLVLGGEFSQSSDSPNQTEGQPRDEATVSEKVQPLGAVSVIGALANDEPEAARRHLPIPKRHETATISTGGRSTEGTVDSTRKYLDEIGQYPLLTKDDEVELAQAYKLGKKAKARIESGEDLTFAERRELRRQILDGEAAERRFVESNLRLVVSIAKRYQGQGMDLLDLIQEGNLGVMHAVEKFDHEKGFKFSTYATWWIRQSISRAIADKSRTIRLPAHMHETLASVRKAEGRFLKENGRQPTLAELAIESGIAEEKIIKALDAVEVSDSFDRPIGDDGNSEKGDFIADPSTSGFDEEVANSVGSKERVQEFLDELSPREREMMRLRFGLVDGVPHTLEEVGREFNVTRERIRQIENNAMRKMRAKLRFSENFY